MAYDYRDPITLSPHQINSKAKKQLDNLSNALEVVSEIVRDPATHPSVKKDAHRLLGDMQYLLVKFQRSLIGD